MIGISSILISTKLEDVIPIYLDEILKDACHNKYERSQITDQEMHVLQTIGFKVEQLTLYEESHFLLKTLVTKSKVKAVTPSSATLIDEHSKSLFDLATFISYVGMLRAETREESVEMQAVAVVFLAMKYL